MQVWIYCSVNATIKFIIILYVVSSNIVMWDILTTVLYKNDKYKNWSFVFLGIVLPSYEVAYSTTVQDHSPAGL